MRFLFFTSAALLISHTMLGQSKENLLFTTNVVKLAADNYGFVVATDGKRNLYFVTIDNEPQIKKIEVDFMSSTQEATFIKSFDLNHGRQKLNLYTSSGSWAENVKINYYSHLNDLASEYAIMFNGVPDEGTSFYIHPETKAMRQRTGINDDGFYVFHPGTVSPD